ncbi:MAG: HrpE/YscL family type III secretion apparatus protein [Rhabdochlamydiaceae bacterium]|nr:HrpE/YscL family type III secretion apparatus protein [Rhabdochlamydiaceae bacterium]
MKFFSLIYHGEVHPATEEKVIPAENFSTLISAEEILKLVKEEVIRYKEEAEKECAILKEAAQKEGFDAGLAQFNEHLLNFDRQLRVLKMDLLKQILPLALKAAKKIVGKELETHPETIVDIVLQSLAPIAHNQRYTIYVNKADKDILESNKPKIKEILDHVQTLTIQERPDVSPGGCIIETESGIINASIENQWRAIETAFERYMKL